MSKHKRTTCEQAMTSLGSGRMATDSGDADVVVDGSDDANEKPNDDMASYDPEDAKDKKNTMDTGEQEQPTESGSPANVAENKEKTDRKKASFAPHSLLRSKKGDSECEEMARRIETKRAERIPIIPSVRTELLETCSKISQEKGYPGNSKIDIEDLMTWKNEVEARVNNAREKKLNSIYFKTKKLLGFRDQDESMLKVLNKAVEVVNEIQLEDDDWFYYRDFGFYYLRQESRWPWMRSELAVAGVIVFLFYLFTPIFFCLIIDDKGVCPDDPTDRNRSYYGWMSALYFASTTMSTVGYGDLSVEKSSSWRVFMGIFYMILAMLVAISAFSAAADAASTPLDDLRDKIFDLIPYYRQSREGRGQALHTRIRQLKYVKLLEITVQFTLLNLIGFFVSRIFAGRSTEPAEQWTWMESFYWAVQTTTTIGYGDLAIPFDMRWFNIFYLALATYFVGNALGKLAGLKQELEETRRYYAWERREVSKGMIEDFQAEEHDDVIDQYEWVLASLLTLGKISSSDITPLMDKFRELAGDKGFIRISDDTPSSDDESSVHKGDFSLPVDRN